MTSIIPKKKLILKVINNEPEKWSIEENEKIPPLKGVKQARHRSHIIQEGNLLYGEENINYEYLNPNITFSLKKLINLKCNECNLIWITPLSAFLKGKGCFWCVEECDTKMIKLYNFSMITFFGSKFHSNKYTYFENDTNKIYKCSE